MRNKGVSNDLLGWDISLPQLGHLAIPSAQYGTIPHLKGFQSLEYVLAQFDTTNNYETLLSYSLFFFFSSFISWDNVYVT